jgi:hypothetical protein
MNESSDAPQPQVTKHNMLLKLELTGDLHKQLQNVANMLLTAFTAPADYDRFSVFRCWTLIRQSSGQGPT